LIDNLRITNPIYFSKQSKVKLRSLNQNERLKFLEIKSLEIIFPEMKQLLPHDENQDRLKMSQFFVCFDLFFHIFTYLKNDFSNKEFDSRWYENYSKEWLKAFLGIYEKNKITPYMHSFIHHIPDFIKKFKNLNKFSTQSLEKLQSLTKKNFLLTNKKRHCFTEQLLNKANRIELINLKVPINELFDRII
jgi:hypothetical protein